MIHVSAIQTDEITEYAGLRKLMPLLPEEKQERIKSFVHRADTIRSLMGEWTIRFLLYSRFGIDPSTVKTACDNYGKPHIMNQPCIFFNISHSGRWIVCAISEKSVGVDVERIAPIDMGIARNYFTWPEYLKLMDLHGIERLQHFYTLWTLKESYLKAIGKGLALPLDSVNLSDFPGSGQKFRCGKTEGHNFYSYDFEKEYKLSACGMEEQFRETIEILEYTDIL